VASLPTDLDTLGDRLRWVRENVLRLGTHALATRLEGEEIEGTSNASITRYETGERSPSIAYVATIARLSGVSLDWVVLNRQPASEAERRLEQIRSLLEMPREMFRPMLRPKGDDGNVLDSSQ
jgi:transcriptional regulator with XRE-family HTH domain